MTGLNTTISGWQSTPDTRGTIDIIGPSFLTIFLCTWTAICLNIPHPKDTQRDILWRKTKWMFWAIVGPEFILTVAIGQRASARKSQQRFHNLGHKEWTVRHSFFADMGGIILQPKSSVPFVVNSRQLAYLVGRNYIPCPNITTREIWDKSKSDTLSRIITLAQATWLVVQLLGRAILRLPTTTLELSAGAIVFCTFGTFVCWLHKPADVERGIVIETEVTTEQILLEAGETAAAPYKHTPLDFVAKEAYTMSHDVMRFFRFRFDNPERPLRVFPNDRFPDIDTWEKIVLFFLTCAYSASHIIAWNFAFPTRTEQVLWRVSSSLLTCMVVFFWLIEIVAARQRFGRWDMYLIGLGLKAAPRPLRIDKESAAYPLLRDPVQRMDAFEKERRHSKPLPLWEIAVLTPVVLVYFAARAYMVAEMFAGLREVPAGVYKTVEWIELIPK